MLFPPPAAAGLGTVAATLSAGATPLPGQSIMFTDRRIRLCTARTGSDGLASCRLGLIKELLVLLSNNYTATYTGSDQYLASSSTTHAFELGNAFHLGGVQLLHSSAPRKARGAAPHRRRDRRYSARRSD